MVNWAEENGGDGVVRMWVVVMRGLVVVVVIYYDGGDGNGVGLKNKLL